MCSQQTVAEIECSQKQWSSGEAAKIKVKNVDPSVLAVTKVSIGLTPSWLQTISPWVTMV